MDKVLFLTCFIHLSLVAAIPAQQSEEIDKTIKNINIESQQDSIIQSMGAKLESLNNRLSLMEKSEAEKEHKTELEQLLNRAKSLSQEGKKEEPSVSRVFRGGERQMQALNPNLSMTGDFFGSLSSAEESAVIDESNYIDGRNQFYFREAEFHIVAALDPYTRGKFFLGIPGIGDDPLSFMIGEAYMEWLNLPANINLKIGLYNTQFGILNRWHDHGLPQVDRPRPLVNLFGKSNFGGIGVAANILLPRIWAHVNELDVEMITGGDGICFDEARDNIVLVSHLKNYYDLTRNAYVEIGFSGAYGHNDQFMGYRTTLVGVDLTYKWSPAGRSHYRTVEFRNEFFASLRETAGETMNRFGFYSYISNKMGARFWLGVRYGYSELPTTAVLRTEWDITPYLDFWQSEFVLMRFQYSYTNRSYAENDHAFFIQTVWAMGPHKHEAY